MSASLSNNQIKFIKSLQQKKFRDEHSLFVVEGEKLVREALDSAFKVKDVYRIDEIGEICMGRISQFSSPSPVLAVVEKPEQPGSDSIEQLVKDGSIKHDFLSLGLDCISDPGNMGTIIRLADWFGIDYIFAQEGTVELYNPKTIQATMGAIFRKRVIYCDLNEIASMFLSYSLPVWGTLLNGENIYSKIESKPRKGLIVMGNESNGISDSLRSLITEKVLIPPYPADANTSESLNVATATAIVLALFRK